MTDTSIIYFFEENNNNLVARLAKGNLLFGNLMTWIMVIFDDLTAGFDDKVVAVVGIGNSGGDIAVELSKVAKQVSTTSFCHYIRYFWVYSVIEASNTKIVWPSGRTYNFYLEVYLITRSGTWVFNRVADYGRPVDSFLNSRFYSSMRNVRKFCFSLHR